MGFGLMLGLGTIALAHQVLLRRREEAERQQGTSAAASSYRRPLKEWLKAATPIKSKVKSRRVQTDEADAAEADAEPEAEAEDSEHGDPDETEEEDDEPPTRAAAMHGRHGGRGRWQGRHARSGSTHESPA